MQNDPAHWHTVLERMGPSDIEAIYDHFGAAMYGAALRMSSTRGQAEVLLEKTFMHLATGQFHYSKDLGSPLLWLLRRLRENASIQNGNSDVDGAAQASLTLHLRCFGLDPLPEVIGPEQGVAEHVDELGNTRHLPLRNALRRV